MADGFRELTPEKLQTAEGVSDLNRMLQFLFLKATANGDNVDVSYGYGTPENVVAKNIGSIFMNLSGSTSTTLYVKTADNGLATGWTAK